MASEFKLDTQLQLTFEAGLNDDGEMTFKRKNFNQVNTDAEADALYAVSIALADLQTHTLHQVIRNNSYSVQN